MMNSNINSGRCQCAWGQLYKIMPDELIAIIDGYVHLSESIIDAMYDELSTNQKLPPTKSSWQIMPNDGRRRNKWSFYGDTQNNSGFDMGRIGSDLSGDVDIACKIVATHNESGKKAVQVLINGDTIDGLKWDGPWLTPFSRISRDRMLHTCSDVLRCIQVTRIYKRPFDSMCDGAHAAIWTWFHGGDPTQCQKRMYISDRM